MARLPAFSSPQFPVAHKAPKKKTEAANRKHLEAIEAQIADGAAAPVVTSAIEEIRAREQAIGNTLEQVEEDLEAAGAKRDEILVMMREMRSEIQALRALLAARGN